MLCKQRRYGDDTVSTSVVIGTLIQVSGAHGPGEPSGSNQLWEKILAEELSTFTFEDALAFVGG